MGVLANHVPSIEQLKPGLVEIVEESGSSKQFFRMCPRSATARARYPNHPQSSRANSFGECHGVRKLTKDVLSQCPVDSPSSSPTRP